MLIVILFLSVLCPFVAILDVGLQLIRVAIGGKIAAVVLVVGDGDVGKTPTLDDAARQRDC